MTKRQRGVGQRLLAARSQAFDVLSRKALDLFKGAGFQTGFNVFALFPFHEDVFQKLVARVFKVRAQLIETFVFGKKRAGSWIGAEVGGIDYSANFFGHHLAIAHRLVELRQSVSRVVRGVLFHEAFFEVVSHLAMRCHQPISFPIAGELSCVRCATWLWRRLNRRIALPFADFEQPQQQKRDGGPNQNFKHGSTSSLGLMQAKAPQKVEGCLP
ncbi:hypothetical protein ABVF61_00560 [Roseibium sp. HPY-6]|uniref:hypothetical protein n=1 Tax=Roseibium sp. HPY-6 TaxID=3229852 RepID=UPI00338E42EB